MTFIKDTDDDVTTFVKGKVWKKRMSKQDIKVQFFLQ